MALSNSRPEHTDYIISFDSPKLGYGKVILDNEHLSGLLPGVTAVVGKNGSGKTTLGTILEKGRYAYGNRLSFRDDIRRIKLLTFTDIHSFTGIDVQYYNQRMESTANEYVPVVMDIFSKKMQDTDWTRYCDAFGLRGIEEKKINYLSSGELRKLLIINALCDHPDLLILDNPYIGLDAKSRDEFDQAISTLKGEGVSVVYLLCDYNDVPEYVDSLLELEDRKIGAPIIGSAEIRQVVESRKNVPSPELSVLPPRMKSFIKRKCDIVFAIRNGHARYGDKNVFDHFDWEIKEGECWALSGPNGSGKSLLLSMVCADNPQGYANDITLFDRKRGSGESIWEIKDSIGYVCPEMQLYFRSNDTIREVIVQGMRNSLNRYRLSTPEERKTADEWMALLDISHLSERKFQDLSSGEQRLVLLARAFVKQPELLVLDEPLHGLDASHKFRIREVISRLTQKNSSSLIFVSHYESEFPDCITHSKQIGI